MSDPRLLEVQTHAGPRLLRVAADQQALRLSELLRAHNLPLNTRCGQRSLCECCVVELLGGELVHVLTGQAVRGDGPPVRVRGCEHRLGAGDVRLHIPPRSLLAYEPQVVSDFKVNVPAAHDPLWQRLSVPGAIAADPAALAAHLARELDLPAPPTLDPPAMPVAAAPPGPRMAILERRETGWAVAALGAPAGGDAATDLPAPPDVGLAVDIGTTTVVVLLVELADGRVLARTAAFNRQLHLGDDVLTRINLCLSDPPMLARLHEALVQDTLAPLIAEAFEQAGLPPASLRAVALAGNTTMLHLLARVDPSPIGVAPFAAPFLHHRVLPWNEVTSAEVNSCPAVHADAAGGPGRSLSAGAAGPGRLPSPPRAHLLPSAAGYIGADIVAGVLSSGLAFDDGPSLLVDVGTNGEIVLKANRRLLACATAAGPAFEGSGLTCGTRAVAGAIAHVRMTADPFDLQLDVIGDAQRRPIGLCGSAYVDLLAEGRRSGLLSPAARFCPDTLADRDRWLVFNPAYGVALRLATGHGNQPVVVSEADLARLLQAKAAIAAGILTLLAQAGLGPADLRSVYLAGGFGMHLNLASAIACGLLPGLRAEQLQLVGNTSLAGAYLALTDSSALDEMIALARTISVVELNLDPAFEGTYIDQLALPDPA